MITSLIALTTLAAASQPVRMIAYWNADGNAQDSVNKIEGKLTGGAKFGEGIKGQAFDFNGKTAALEMPDNQAYQITGSFSIDAWIFVRELPTNGTSPAGQILFRGDDRCGLDPYSLTVASSGHLTFGVSGSDGGGASLQTIAPIKRWSQVVASFDAREGDLCLWVDGVLRAQGSTLARPFRDLDPNWIPGLSIGNVQAPQAGRHRQPFNGLIDEIRMFEGVITPSR